MTITYYTFRPGVFIHASGEIGTHRFILSAVVGNGCMDVVVRTTPNLGYPLRFSLPSDVEKREVELMLEILLGSQAEVQEAAA